MQPADHGLEAAVLGGDVAGVRAALRRGANARGTRSIEAVVDRERRPGEESLLHTAVRGRHHDVVAELLARGADPGACDTTCGRTPLADAAAGGDLRLVLQLLAAGAAPVAASGNHEADALAAAILGGHAAVAAALVHAGARATAHAFALASQRGRTELAELCMRNGAPVVGADALTAAARGGSVAMLQWLAAHGVELGGSAGGEALCEAANAGQLAAVEHLLAAGAPHDHRNEYAWTPLHFAAYQSSDPAVCAALLRAGADPRATDGTGQTPLDWAREAGRAANVALLERAWRGE